MAEALAVLDHYRAMQEALQQAGDPHARWRLHVLWWVRHDVEEEGLTGLSRLQVGWYGRQIERLTRTVPEPLQPGSHRGPAAS